MKQEFCLDCEDYPCDEIEDEDTLILDCDYKKEVRKDDKMQRV